MPTIQISKIQLRRGLASDLPEALDDGEFGFTTDEGRLFIGQDSPTTGMPNFQRVVSPFQNIEVLTENSPPEVLRPVIADNRTGFLASVPLEITASLITLQTLDIDAVAQDVLLDLPVSGVNAMVQYFVFGSDHLATRQGVLNVVWNSGMIGAPYLLDTPAVAVGLVADLQWAATVVSGPHVALQYTNQTGDTPTVFFRIDRPFG